MKRSIRIGSRYRVPYRTEAEIERDAECLLSEWKAKGQEITAPVPLDDLVELHLGLTYEVSDLRQDYDNPDILGAIWLKERIIGIDSSLDPQVHPSMLGRFNFTLAHEIGHWRLHREYLGGDPEVPELFEGRGRPTVICRDGDLAPEEWQANYFAACLLMPRPMLRAAWEVWRGSDEAVEIRELPATTSRGDRQADEHSAIERFCRPLAEQFAVSAQAMRIRLLQLGLVVKEKESRLF